MTHICAGSTVGEAPQATAPPAPLRSASAASPLPRQRTSTDGHPPVVPSTRIDPAPGDPAPTDPAPGAQGMFLPGIEPFRWLRECPPGMFPGIFKGLLRRWRGSRR